MNRRIVLALSVAVSSAAAGGVCLLAHRHSPHSSQAAAVAAKADANGALSRSSAQTLPRTGWEAGAEYVHEFEYRVVLGPEKNSERAGQRLEFHVKGQATSTVSERIADAVRVRLALTHLSLEVPQAGAGSSAGAAATTRALSSPFFVDYDAHGRALRVHVQPSLDAIALGILRELVATSQFSSPEQPSSRWAALETDPVGEYEAEYVARGERAFLRQKSRYVRVASRAGLSRAGNSAPTVRASVAEFALDDWGRVASLKSHVDVTTPTPVEGDGGEFEAETDLSLRFVSRTRRNEGLPFSVAGLLATALTPGEQDFALAAQNADRSLAGNADVPGLLRDLGALKADDRQAASSVQARMSALFRVDSAAISSAVARLNPSNAPTILGALGSAATPEAQKALADVTRDEHKDTSERQAAIDAMLGLEHPTRDVPDALKSVLNSKDPELKNNGSLMLGVMARRMASDEPEKADEVSGKLASDLAASTDPQERLRLLGSLGNTGSALGLPQISQSLQSEDPAIRAQAASALRFVPGPQADELLSKVIVSDPNSVVRAAALEAASYRSYEPLASALETMAKEPEVGLRMQLVATLSKMAFESGDPLLLLDRIAQSDPSKDVRDHAKRALERAASLARN